MRSVNNAYLPSWMSYRGIRGIRGIRALGAALLAFAVSPLLSACSETSPPPPAVVALLDWEQGTIDFPIERFVMSPAEMSVAWAAYNIAYVRCLTDKQEVSAAELARSAEMLRTPFILDGERPEAPFGRWDANYIRAHSGESSDVSFASGRGTSASQDKETLCSAAQELKDLAPGSIHYGVGEDQLFWPVSELYVDALNKVYATGLYSSLSKQMGECLNKRGYQLPPPDRDGRPAMDLDIPWSDGMPVVGVRCVENELHANPFTSCCA
ncbi:MAG: hypothetical protein LBC29_02270 [Propionibacteriaceae bacterium]|nr:hypothetical protein [Propionibacteriaceae bacterium]